MKAIGNKILKHSLNSPSRLVIVIGLVFLALTTFKDSNNVTLTYKPAEINKLSN